MSQQNERLPGEAGSLEAVEKLLAGFAAATPRIDRDRLMFAAGQASAATGSAHPTIWRASTAVLAASTLALAFSLWTRPASPPSVPRRDLRPEVARHDAPPTVPLAPAPRRLVDEPVPPPPPASRHEPILAEVAPNNYVRTREVALRMGLDAIGSPGGSGGSSTEARSLGQWLNDFNRDLRTSGTSASLETTSAM